MPKKTREQKIKASERRNINFTIKERDPGQVPAKQPRLATGTNNQVDQIQRRFFMADFRKSVFITLLIIAFELAAKYFHLDTVIKTYLKI